MADDKDRPAADASAADQPFTTVTGAAPPDNAAEAAPGAVPLATPAGHDHPAPEPAPAQESGQATHAEQAPAQETYAQATQAEQGQAEAAQAAPGPFEPSLYEAAPWAAPQPSTAQPAAAQSAGTPPAAADAKPVDQGAKVAKDQPSKDQPDRKQAKRQDKPAKARSRPSRRARNPLVVAGNVLLTLTVLVGFTLMAALSYSETLLRKPGPLAAEKVVNLSRNSGFRDIGEQLEREGVVGNAWAFVAGVMLRQAREDLKAGEYLFPRGASLNDVIGIIVTGKSVLHQITIPEGLTSEQTVARLLENDVLVGPIREIPREGSLLPETYRFNRGITREQILQRMAADQRRVVAEIWAKRAPNLPLRSPEDLVTLASIVEKETGKPTERARVASVFLNRLGRRMKLQSDPTIIYGLVGGKGSLGRPILRSDIDRPTAYNTYVIDGLPPGPIANPGRAALEATANPAETRDLFFVADGTGGHVFAETLDEHNRNVARWREIERQQSGQTAPPPAAAPAAPTQRPTLPPRSRN
ncbi:endolytic transglycosylase MltG [Blastochloris tepida]|uniref:Endolytic murein transglycosylase n=1 Tax=Blastochloris tepida TaxID=2233851 RepID=A0A348G325_9HYPH|nr:hypothetical protein BLTE_26430 [Blastochloris tepida]